MIIYGILPRAVTSRDRRTRKILRGVTHASKSGGQCGILSCNFNAIWNVIWKLVSCKLPMILSVKSCVYIVVQNPFLVVCYYLVQRRFFFIIYKERCGPVYTVLFFPFHQGMQHLCAKLKNVSELF